MKNIFGVLGDLLIIAPGVRQFGEDVQIDKLIREHGYRTTPEVLKALEGSKDLMKNLSAVAHLIHGSSENRFKVTYAPGKRSRQCRNAFLSFDSIYNISSHYQ